MIGGACTYRKKLPCKYQSHIRKIWCKEECDDPIVKTMGFEIEYPGLSEDHIQGDGAGNYFLATNLWSR